ncbi:RsiV family protein [Bacillus spongiae]|uniref:RsiV family protein n=1 Tax=Bacillus spongiae TaxID=2683610 RepID=A0ABU8H8L4_9BACI
MDKKMEQLKREYLETPIPDELEFVVEKALKKKKRNVARYNWLIGFGAAAVMFVSFINTSPFIAKATTGIPVVSDIIQVLTFREFTFKGERHHADIDVPTIQNLDDPSLESTLNQKYLEEGKQLYDELINSIGDINSSLSVIHSNFEIKTDNETILSLGREVVRFTQAGSSNKEMSFDTIDKKNKLLITLPMLFKDDRYIDVISQNIIQQMKQQEEESEHSYYFNAEDSIETIRKLDNFYINSEGKLVISYNKYEVAAGVMGRVEFIIPTDVISDLLVSHEYIK